VSTTFRDLIAWPKAKSLALHVYNETAAFPRQEQFGMTSQLRRAATSVVSNIAEGKGRGTKRDFCHFLMQARGSLYEVETDVELARDLGYLDVPGATKLLGECDEVGRILNGLINSTRDS
jgi:four helix bundle protein